MNLIKKVVLPWLFIYLLIPVDSLAMSESEQERLSLERSRSSSSSSLSDFIYSDVSGAYKRECLSIKLVPSDIQPPENIIPISLLQEQRRKYLPEDDDFIELLPNEILWRVFSFLDINDLGRVAQVSTRWKRITENLDLWRFMGAKYYGDFLSSNDLAQNPKKQVIYHYLSVIVNHTENLEEIDRLVSSYQLHLYNPFFKKYITEMDSHLWCPREYFQNREGIMYTRECFSSREELIMQGNEYFIEKKIEGLNDGHNGYKQDLEAAREFNEFLSIGAIKRLLSER